MSESLPRCGQVSSAQLPSTVDDQAVTIDGTPIQVLFAAEDDIASRLVPLIESALWKRRFTLHKRAALIAGRLCF